VFLWRKTSGLYLPLPSTPTLAVRSLLGPSQAGLDHQPCYSVHPPPPLPSSPIRTLPVRLIIDRCGTRLDPLSTGASQLRIHRSSPIHHTKHPVDLDRLPSPAPPVLPCAMAMTGHQYLASTPHARADIPGELPVRTTSSTGRPSSSTVPAIAYAALSSGTFSTVSPVRPSLSPILVVYPFIHTCFPPTYYPPTHSLHTPRNVPFQTRP
jgi:hypothetical protein